MSDWRPLIFLRKMLHCLQCYGSPYLFCLQVIKYIVACKDFTFEVYQLEFFLHKTYQKYYSTLFYETEVVIVDKELLFSWKLVVKIY